MTNTAAAAPIAAPRASALSLVSTSALASSISSRMSSCAFSETSWIAAAIEACESEPWPFGLTGKALEDQGGDEATGERGTYERLGALLGSGRRRRARAGLRE